MGKVEDLRNRCYELYEKLWVFTNREPFLTIRRAIWCGLPWSHCTLGGNMRRHASDMMSSSHRYRIGNESIPFSRILTAGWALALGYLLAAVGMVTSERHFRNGS